MNCVECLGINVVLDLNNCKISPPSAKMPFGSRLNYPMLRSKIGEENCVRPVERAENCVIADYHYLTS